MILSLFLFLAALRLPPSYRALILWDPVKHGAGMACPVGVGAVAYTANHVVEATHVWTDPQTGTPFTWKEFRVMKTDPAHDLATIAPTDEGDGIGLFPHPIPEVSKSAPAVGEAVEIYGMWHNLPVIWHGWVLGVDGDGDLIIDSNGFPGTSGGCVVSLQSGKLLAIIVVAVEENGARMMMGAKPVWGRK